ncbi:ULK/ULK protein kinase [Phytophthora cinnamomi]|uniref:ULK/ULK protein kinase n=1 Tax=Phytophthora cinnamomi TaxID=4785 RepID=UPI0035596D4E|nr:ULK/ULK protein kinase [Phytophthora cinnamomi]
MAGRASIGEYVVTSKLGSGSFAVVYRGYHKTSKTPVAIKALSLHKLSGKLLTNLEMEIAIMRQIDHPNVVKLYDIKKTDKHMYLMLEYCAGGDLQQYMRRRAQEGGGDRAARLLSEDVARHFLRELAKGMQCLWQRNLIHRDLKPQNLLLVEDSPTSALKIADFGFARHLATTSMAETLCGSPLYMAPEILRFQKYDAKADLWSVGTILFEMLAGRPPYGGANHVQLLANIERQPLRFPPTLQLSRECRHLLVALLQRKPALRLGFAEFFADPFVDLQPLPEQVEEAEAARRSSTLSTTASIREEEDEDEQGLSGRWGFKLAVCKHSSLWNDASIS